MSLSRESAARLHRMAQQWARAIACEAAEHGVPNSFGVLELAGKYQGLKKREGYHLGTSRIAELIARLGMPVLYLNGRFYVSQPAPEASR